MLGGGAPKRVSKDGGMVAGSVGEDLNTGDGVDLNVGEGEWDLNPSGGGLDLNIGDGVDRNAGEGEA